MARTRMVTRTITATEVTALTIEVSTQKVSTSVFTLTGYSYTDDTALKYIKKNYETNNFKIVSIISLTEHEEIYGLLERDFLRYAHKLDGERHFINEDVEIEDEEPTEEPTTEEPTEAKKK